MDNSAKRILGVAIFGLGVLIGIPGCVFWPMSAFAAGQNDSSIELIALFLMSGALLPGCLLAFWKRLLSSVFLTSVGLYNAGAMLYQRHYMIAVRHIPQNKSAFMTLVGSWLIYFPCLALGLFALVTEYFNWPRLLSDNNAATKS